MLTKKLNFTATALTAAAALSIPRRELQVEEKVKEYTPPFHPEKEPTEEVQQGEEVYHVRRPLVCAADHAPG